MIIINKSKCPQNHKCPMVNLCKSKAISQNGFGAPKINKELCVECLLCVKHCPYKAFAKA